MKSNKTTSNYDSTLYNRQHNIDFMAEQFGLHCTTQYRCTAECMNYSNGSAEYIQFIFNLHSYYCHYFLKYYFSIFHHQCLLSSTKLGYSDHTYGALGKKLV